MAQHLHVHTGNQCPERGIICTKLLWNHACFYLAPCTVIQAIFGVKRSNLLQTLLCCLRQTSPGCQQVCSWHWQHACLVLEQMAILHLQHILPAVAYNAKVLRCCNSYTAILEGRKLDGVTVEVCLKTHVPVSLA